MPGTILLGARYRQETGVSMDRAEIVSMDETVETAACTLKNVPVIREFTPIEHDAAETKCHSAGIGR